MSGLMIKNACIISPADGINMQGDLLIRDGKIAKVGQSLSDGDATLIDATGLTLVPGLIDIHVHLRDPGYTHKEDIASGCAAAAAGGFTAMCSMPNTKPTTDTPETVAYIVQKATSARVYPVAAITTGLRGENMTDFTALKNAGAVGVSDDGRPVESGRMMLDALCQSKAVGIKVVSHCEDLTIVGKGIMNKGEVSARLGVEGMDRASEDSSTAREIAIAAACGAPIHICHVSTKGSVDVIRDAKARGVAVTCETAPHYLYYTDEKLSGRNANYRMNPPLRTAEDRDALIAALIDGTIDAIATDHAPHSKEEKSDFVKAPNGVVGLETSFGASYTKLVLEHGMSMEQLVELMSTSPARVMNIPGGSIAVGEVADITLLNLTKKWIVDPSSFHSKSQNTVFEGEKLTGKAAVTILGGRIVYDERM